MEVAGKPQWRRVDLGATYELRQVSIRFEHSERSYFAQ